MLLFLASGCAGGPAGSAPSASPSSAAPGQLACTSTVAWLGDHEGSALEPGSYSSLRFRPCFSLTVAEAGWRVEEGNAPNLIVLAFGSGDPAELPFLDFVGPTRVYDPEDPARFLDLPVELADWVRSHPHVEAGPVDAIAVGGVEGQAFEVAVKSLPAKQPPNCFGGPCLPLFPVKEGQSPPYSLAPGVRQQLIVVVFDGTPLVIGISSPPGAFDRFLPKARTLLESLAFLSPQR